MKIKDAEQTYQTQKTAIAKKQNELKKKMETSADGSTLFGNEAAVLQLTYDALDKKQNEYANYLDQLSEQRFAIEELENTKQQGKAAEKAGKDLAKIMEVARRIMKGAKVPGSDERKLMEFDSKLYQMAKSIGAMAKQRKRKEYKSLWEDEEKQETQDPSEVADEAEAAGAGPELVTAEATMASVGGMEESGE